MKPIPIVVIGYNRPASLQRTLSSLSRADYPSDVRVSLYINIDGGGPNGAAEVARAFTWPYGDKIVTIRPDRMGMRENALASGDLAASRGAVIFVEDDSFLSPAFYRFCQQAYEAYAETDHVFAVSLYAMQYCEYDQHRFEAVPDGYDNYFMQSGTTWATLFFRKGWLRFREWLSVNGSSSVTLSDNVPRLVTEWPDTSWKRFINKFLPATGCYVCYPRASYAANFIEKGTHFSGVVNNYRVAMVSNYTRRNLSTLNASGSLYDPFFEISPSLLARHLDDVDPADLDVDLRQIKLPSQLRRSLVLTTRRCVAPIRQFGHLHYPWETNVIFECEGGTISLAKREHVTARSRLSSSQISRYFQSDIGGVREIDLILSRAVEYLFGRR